MAFRWRATNGLLRSPLLSWNMVTKAEKKKSKKTKAKTTKQRNLFTLWDAIPPDKSFWIRACIVVTQMAAVTGVPYHARIDRRGRGSGIPHTSQHSMLGHHRLASETPFNGVSLAGRQWPASSVTCIWILSSKRSCQSWTPSDKPFWIHTCI